MRFASFTANSGAVSLLLLGLMAMLSLSLFLHLGSVGLRNLSNAWQQLNDDRVPQELLCDFPLQDLLQENFDPMALLLPLDTPRICLLPPSDYGNRWQDSTQLNVLFCALLDYSAIADFQALGKTCA